MVLFAQEHEIFVLCACQPAKAARWVTEVGTTLATVENKLTPQKNPRTVGMAGLLWYQVIRTESNLWKIARRCGNAKG